MVDNEPITHGLHWLTLSEDRWGCANPDCDWHLHFLAADHERAQHLFDTYHTKLSEPSASVHP